jgi:hypothetical protein
MISARMNLEVNKTERTVTIMATLGLPCQSWHHHPTNHASVLYSRAQNKNWAATYHWVACLEGIRQLYSVHLLFRRQLHYPKREFGH